MGDLSQCRGNRSERLIDDCFVETDKRAEADNWGRLKMGIDAGFPYLGSGMRHGHAKGGGRGVTGVFC